jgi:hypothetical protein
MQPLVCQGTLNDAVGTHSPVSFAASCRHVDLFARVAHRQKVTPSRPRLLPLVATSLRSLLPFGQPVSLRSALTGLVAMRHAPGILHAVGTFLSGSAVAAPDASLPSCRWPVALRAAPPNIGLDQMYPSGYTKDDDGKHLPNG